MKTNILILVILVVLRHILLKIKNSLPEQVRKSPFFNDYLFLFVASYAVVFYKTKDHQIATLISMMMVYGQIIYRYSVKNKTSANNTTFYIVGVIVMLWVTEKSKTFQRSHIQWGIFLMSVYLLASLIEWLIHRYVMHCYVFWPSLLTKNSKIYEPLKGACLLHKKHHLSVNEDMTLNHHPEIGEVAFYWKTLFALFIPLTILVVFFTKVCEFNISLSSVIGVCVGMIVLFGVIWNTIHPQFHDTHVDLTTKHPPAMLPGQYKDSVYFTNHKAHHNIKGAQKGNYNVVFLGVDELFGTNRE